MVPTNEQLQRRLLELDVQLREQKVKNQELRSIVLRLKADNAKADLESTEMYTRPHRRQFTRVYQEPDGEWICTTADADENVWEFPAGRGDTPAKACEEFDKCWNGD